jgi:hypothetical protein
MTPHEKETETETETVSMGLLIVGAHPNIARHATQRMKAAVGVNRLIRILVTHIWSRRFCILLSITELTHVQTAGTPLVISPSVFVIRALNRI